MRKRALITGVRGQDGSYLAELLLSKGYEVLGMLPHRNVADMSNLLACRADTNFQIVHGDMTDPHSIDRIIGNSHPDEIYNLAAQSFVAKSWETPQHTMQVNCVGLLHILEAVLRHKLVKRTKIYQASTSEQFGKSPAPQGAATPFNPCSPYGVSKTAAHLLARNYRESYDMRICCGILFNHESPRRPSHFLTQKVAKAAAEIAAGRQKKLRLGNLEAKRDWGWAPEYVELMWQMVQQNDWPELVVGTGESHSVREFVKFAFAYLELDYRDYVKIDEKLVRPVDVPELRADMREDHTFGWSPKIKFADVVPLMVQHWQR